MQLCCCQCRKQGHTLGSHPSPKCMNFLTPPPIFEKKIAISLETRRRLYVLAPFYCQIYPLHKVNFGTFWNRISLTGFFQHSVSFFLWHKTMPIFVSKGFKIPTSFKEIRKVLQKYQKVQVCKITPCNLFIPQPAALHMGLVTCQDSI